jgi:hypothetical protein
MCRLARAPYSTIEEYEAYRDEKAQGEERGRRREARLRREKEARVAEWNGRLSWNLDNRVRAWAIGFACIGVGSAAFSTWAWYRHADLYSEANDIQTRYYDSEDEAEVRQLRADAEAKADDGHAWFGVSRGMMWTAVGCGAVSGVLAAVKIGEPARIRGLRENLKRAGVEVSVVPDGPRVAAVVRY